MTILSYQSAHTRDGVPQYRLYSPAAVLIASFLGTSTAGSIFIAINFRRLGQRNYALIALAVGIAVTVMPFIISPFFAAFLFSGLAQIVTLSIFFATYLAAEILQGSTVKHHRLRGGQIEPLWKAAGVGIATLLLFILTMIALYSFLKPSTFRSITRIYDTSPSAPAPFVTASPTEKVYYLGGATEYMANTTADALKSDGFFDGKRPKTIVLKSVSGTIELSFVVSATTTISPPLEAYFKKLGEHVATPLELHPLVVRLVDPDLNEIWSISIP